MAPGKSDQQKMKHRATAHYCTSYYTPGYNFFQPRVNFTNISTRLFFENKMKTFFAWQTKFGEINPWDRFHQQFTCYILAS